MQITYSLRLPREAATVPLVRTICGDALDRLGVTPACRHDVALALTEACANVVQHAGGTYEYKVDVELSHESCDISVIDDGPGIDASARSDVMPDGNHEGGRGIPLMRRVVDDVDVDSTPGAGTVVHLQKQLELEDDSVLWTIGDRGL